jgi:protein-disulfide isomerase
MANARAAKSAREKAAQLRLEADRKAARQRTVIAGILVLVVILVAVGITVFVRSLPTHSATPRNLVDGGILVGNTNAKATVELYEDFQCPVCKQFEESAGSTLEELTKSGQAKIIYRPVAILDWASSTGYSTRALNMVAATVDSNPAAFDKLHDSLFANQPPENSAGLPDDKLIELAVAAGANKDVVTKAAKEQPFKDWTKKQSDDLSKRFPPGGTPTVVVNGKKLEDNSPDSIKKAVEAAAKA